MSGAFLSPLRACLKQLNRHVWAEITVGSSYHGYKALDAYVRIFGSQIVSADEEAWYLLNMENGPYLRAWKRPEDWWGCHHWISRGQKQCISEWTLELLCGIEVSTPQAAMRMRTIMGHCAPAYSGELLDLAPPRPVLRAVMDMPVPIVQQEAAQPAVLAPPGLALPLPLGFGCKGGGKGMPGQKGGPIFPPGLGSAPPGIGQKGSFPPGPKGDPKGMTAKL